LNIGWLIFLFSFTPLKPKNQILSSDRRRKRYKLSELAIRNKMRQMKCENRKIGVDDELGSSANRQIENNRLKRNITEGAISLASAAIRLRPGEIAYRMSPGGWPGCAAPPDAVYRFGKS
jgi:hypothetical protein